MFEDFTGSTESMLKDLLIKTTDLVEQLQKEVLRLQRAEVISQNREKYLNESLAAALAHASDYKSKFERAERERDKAQAKLLRLGYRND